MTKNEEGYSYPGHCKNHGHCWSPHLAWQAAKIHGKGYMFAYKYCLCCGKEIHKKTEPFDINVLTQSDNYSNLAYHRYGKKVISSKE